MPVFSSATVRKWRCLYEWSNAELGSDLKPIRDAVLEIKTLKFQKFPRFLVSFHDTNKAFPVGMGVDMTECMRETSDPLELRELLSYSPNGLLLARELLMCYESVFPNLAACLDKECVPIHTPEKDEPSTSSDLP